MHSPLDDHHPRLDHPSENRSWIEIDLDAMAENLRAYRRLVAPSGVCCAVKADAYGHGAVETARLCLEAGAERLAVATCREGEELRHEGIDAPILVLGNLLPEEVEPAVEAGLTLAVHEIETAVLASLAASQRGLVAPLHLKVDTGMGRLGVLPGQALHLATEVGGLPGVALEGVFMHFAEALDEAYSRRQFALFNAVCREFDEAGIRIPLRHAANSAAAALYPEARCDFIRLGISLYGIADGPAVRERVELKPVMHWRAHVLQIKDYPAGASLGYNRTFVTDRPSRIAVLPVGYADGYRRELGNRAEVLLHGRRAPVVGRVSMDYTLADVTDCPDVRQGTAATLLGRDGEDCIAAEELAALLPGENIPHEIVTAVGDRVGRWVRRPSRPSPQIALFPPRAV